MGKSRIDGAGRGITGAMLGVALVLAGSGGLAQLPPGYSGSSSLAIIEDDEAFRALNGYGSCFAQNNTADALALMATRPGSPEEVQLFNRRIGRASVVCLGGGSTMRMPRFLLRGAIAEGLYRRGIALPANLVLANPASGTPTRSFAEAALCYTASHRDQVRALIDRTRIGSREEFEHLSEMAPDYFLCLPEDYRGGQFAPVRIRVGLAEALYRMPVATAAAEGTR